MAAVVAGIRFHLGFLNFILSLESHFFFCIKINSPINKRIQNEFIVERINHHSIAVCCGCLVWFFAFVVFLRYFFFFFFYCQLEKKQIVFHAKNGCHSVLCGFSPKIFSSSHFRFVDFYFTLRYTHKFTECSLSFFSITNDFSILFVSHLFWLY